MRTKGLSGVVFLLIISMVFYSNAIAGRNVRVFGKSHATTKAKKMKKGIPGKEKPFKTLIKDKVAIKGLFTFYHDTTDNSMLMEIKPEQMGPIYLCNETRSQAEGAYFDNGAMGRAFPFYIKKVGKKIMFLQKNLRVRADSTSPMEKAVKRGISDNLFAFAMIKSKPQDSTGAILIDPTDLFIRDEDHISYYLGRMAKMGIMFDKRNSYFQLIKSFPLNTEIDVKLHFKSSKPINSSALPSPYDMFHTYHYSLSTLPKTDYVPRIADDRVGYFLTMYQDYTNLDKTTPYVRYINRWNLKKKYPDSALSEPVKPIVYWVENTVPQEYRSSVAKGIEFWNKAFEKIGFKNVMVAKQMPDDATWDPADVRYSCVRWMVMPGAGYAVGPSHANPFTGQIYDADVRVSADFIRYMFNNMQDFIKPISYNGDIKKENNPLQKAMLNNPEYCNYASESAKEAAFGLAYIDAVTNTLADKDSLTREYVHSYITELVAHEIGHTLGLRHNFKASTIYTLEEINDRNFTKVHSLSGSVMDYEPPNLAGPNKKQGEFYTSVPGPYDDWAIAYGYTDFGAKTPQEELPQLQKIASRSADTLLAYGTDEDAYGNSPKSIDPKCNLFDFSNDPLAFSEHKMKLTKDLWDNAINKFDTSGNRYQKIYRVFQTGWRSYDESAIYASKYIGGIYHYRNHIGDPNGKIPFQPVSAKKQRQAMKFLRDYIFAPDAFTISADLLNKLQQENLPDFKGSIYTTPQIDYPIHKMALLIQNISLNMLYSPYILGRLLNNQLRYKKGEEHYTMSDMFSDVRHAIWSEIIKPANINSFHRQLQMNHLKRIINIYLGNTSTYPNDAITLAANDLDIIEAGCQKSLKSAKINNMTKAHLKEVIRQIKAAKGAKRNFTQTLHIMR